MVFHEKRVAKKVVPENIIALLTDPQVQALRRIENFGWTLKFVRRPMFQAPIVVVENASGMGIGVLEEGGEVNLQPDIVLRESA